MTKERACANGLNVRQKPHSEQNPYHMAIFLAEMIKAASHIVDEYTFPQAQTTGISGLLSVIIERADALSLELDAGVFCDGWPALREAIDRDPKLGLEW